MEGIVTTLNRNCNMKKIFISMAVVLSVLASCNPAEDSYDNNAKTYTQEALSDCFTFTQANENGESAPDGNYFTFNTTPSTIVTVLTKNNDGSENILSKGKATGTFAIVPRRGASTSQTFYVRSMNADGTWTEVEKTANVFVPSDLTPEMKLLASDSYGSKIWKWDTEFRTDGGAWGNLGYTDGNFLSGNGDGLWWGCPPADLVDQLKHSDTGVATGEEDPNAYMEFFDDGTLKTYDASGKEIRSGKYSVEGYTGERNHASVDGSVANWSLGTFKTTAGAILFPFKINGGGEKPTEFELMELDANHLKLIYAPEGTASWGEATWWAFKSESDAEASLTGFSSKSWTWDTEYRTDGGAWGNLGYTDGNFLSGSGDGLWWGCPPAGLTDQMKHSDTGTPIGEEDPNAYMTFSLTDGTVTSYAANGTQIRKGKFEIQNWGNGKRSIASVDGSVPNWALGNLHTDAGSILFPFKINGGGEKPTDFEIMELNGNHLKLIYAPEGTASWGEATWWAFKAKK